MLEREGVIYFTEDNGINSQKRTQSGDSRVHKAGRHGAEDKKNKSELSADEQIIPCQST